MITNIPKHQEFENLGLQCFCKSFEMLFKVGDDYENIDDSIKEEVASDKFWNYNAITVRTSLIVLFQGLEYLMKMEIVKHSAFLLLEKNQNEWPTLPNKKNRSFDELQTISGENLLSVFCAISSEKKDLPDFVEHFEDIRIKRNKLTHSAGLEELDYKYVLEQNLFFLTSFYHKQKWLEIFHEMFLSEPTFGYWDWDIEKAEFYRVLNFLERELGKGKLNNYLNYNLKSRRYCCPECNYWLNKHVINKIRVKWAFLTPNTFESTKIVCLICMKEYNVERKDCREKDCKGNVINNDNYEDLCLTCLKIE